MPKMVSQADIHAAILPRHNLLPRQRRRRAIRVGKPGELSRFHELRFKGLGEGGVVALRREPVEGYEIEFAACGAGLGWC